MTVMADCPAFILRDLETISLRLAQMTAGNGVTSMQLRQAHELVKACASSVRLELGEPYKGREWT